MDFYTINLYSIVISLFLWVWFKERKSAFIFGLLFFSTLGIHVYTMFMTTGSAASFFKYTFIEMIFIGIFSATTNKFRNKKELFLAVPILGLFMVSYVIKPLVKNHTNHSKEISIAEDGELLVQLTSKSDIEKIKPFLKEHKLKYRFAFNPKRPDDTFLDEYIIVDIPKKSKHTLAWYQNTFQEMPFVDWVEPNEIIQMDIPNPIVSKKIQNPTQIYDDPQIIDQWNLETTSSGDWFRYLKDYKIEKPKKVAKIAILDTGVDANHEDLKGNYISTQKKYDQDENSHGTHCAGIAGAVTNNGIGIASLAPPNGQHIQITGIKVLSSFGGGTQQTIIKGIIEAVDSGADVISLSLGGRSSQKKERAYNQVVKYANERNVILVVAAGNSSADAKRFAPANSKGVIVVTAIDNQLNLASFSNFSSDLEMVVAAPGVDILSTVPGDSYKKYSGTSMATPMVAGLVGLIKSQHPDWDAKRVFQLLNKTGKPTNDTARSGKLIQPLKCFL